MQSNDPTQRENLGNLFSQNLQNYNTRLSNVEQELMAKINSEGATVLLEDAFTEIEKLLEELQVTTEKLYQQQDEFEQNQNEIERERQRYRELFELAVDAYIVTDCLGKIEQVNQAAELMLGWNRDRAIGSFLVACIMQDWRDRFRTELNRLSNSTADRITDLELWVKPHQGRPIPVSVSVRAIDVSGELRLHWLIRDITRRKQQEIKSQMRKDRIETMLSQQGMELSKAISEKNALIQEKTSRISLQDYLNTSVGYLLEAYKIEPRDLAVKINIDRVFLTLELAIAIGTIVNELIETAILHNFPYEKGGRIWVCCYSSSSQAILRVYDDGIAFAKRYSLSDANTPPLTKTMSLVTQLRATVRLDSQEYTEFELAIPTWQS